MSVTVDAHTWETEPVLVSLGCDYLTATARDRDRAMALHSKASALFRVQRDFGNESRPWGMAGFSGWKCGSVQVGVRGEEVCVRLSSDSAARSWRDVVHLADNVSRIDLQATVQVETNLTKLIDKYKRAARRNSAQCRDKKRVRWVQEHHGGYTLYLGNRQSNVFGRIYDKAVESKLPEFRQCVRFEAQYQYRLARYVADELYRTSRPIPRIASYVSQFFNGRGVPLEINEDDTARYTCSRPRSDAEKNLAWLQASVKPCIMRLMDLGLGEEVFRALGLISDADRPLDQLGHNSTDKGD